jgi:hypothetical protein
MRALSFAAQAKDARPAPLSPARSQTTSARRVAWACACSRRRDCGRRLLPSSRPWPFTHTCPTLEASWLISRDACARAGMRRRARGKHRQRAGPRLGLIHIARQACRARWREGTAHACCVQVYCCLCRMRCRAGPLWRWSAARTAVRVFGECALRAWLGCIV